MSPQVLIAAGPESAAHEAREGWLPLTLALVYRAAADVVASLLEAYPNAAWQRSESFGCLPIHFAAKYANPRVIGLLLSANPEAASIPDSDGRLPLHVAAASRPDELAIAMLLEHFPSAAHCRDSDGYLPLHVAVTNEAGAGAVQRLLNAHPDGARARVADCQLPLHLAVRCSCSPQIPRLLSSLLSHSTWL